MEASQFGVLGALVYAGCMVFGAFMNLTWLAKVRPTIKKQSRMSYRELIDRIDHGKE